MNTRFLESFLLVVQLGSFRAAAERLHVTQAAISNRIASLEEEIGARVFVRDPGDLRLTPVGLRLISYGERMLELQQNIIQLGRTDQNLLGSVRIGAIESVVHTWLVGFMQHLQTSYPGIEVQLSSESTERLHRSLRDGDVDIALQTDQMIGEGFVSTACLPMTMGWVGQPELAPEFDNNLRLVLSRPTVTLSRGSQPYLMLKDLYRRVDLPMGKVHCVSSIAAIVRLVKCGFGNALIPLPPVREEIERGDLRIVPCSHALPQQGLVVSYLESRASDAIRFVAELACQEADRFMRTLQPPFSQS
ncbi:MULTISPECIES: LysR family transcriptional regulator [Paraburkholderia]|uniref:LysR family transcriptional regulator n=1 Tax=Paraburkholderia TaxID=1822464 RepID=UPI0006B5B75B|nr:MULTISPECIES: LysR family transcriptional regulator [Paraburkholderia]KPD15761.1 LysR family transcriptional regulator [Burkholderia sp. ST111]MBK5153483.1 LysR family transcriptional regulator [Burkholderia sp. R-69608]MBK5185570.1 LysR family transcriptional regulator [Burkholderia sp. R-69749]CAE6881305.1 HTH-type transcriptional regulator GltR [Paraburkholderia domus]CAE6972302.1 HTH-type transcriptional regulator GltR [Paraburkholderia nemoris]